MGVFGLDFGCEGGEGEEEGGEAEEVWELHSVVSGRLFGRRMVCNGRFGAGVQLEWRQISTAW